jgi:hypothetical protein
MVRARHHHEEDVRREERLVSLIEILLAADAARLPRDP